MDSSSAGITKPSILVLKIFSDAAAESLAKARSIKQLRRLTISGKKLTAVTAKAFWVIRNTGKPFSL
ncbi:MAG: hypothetical protein CM1200mP16_03730 [Nitrospina sp.]|nr:MAG: hypothetical protein CM1200mP16_03730 [Nitrospina sp.]